MIKEFTCGILDSNTYVVWEENTREGMIIDCGVNPLTVHPYISENKLEIKYIVLTHGHFDHCEYLESYCNYYQNAKILCHVDELTVLGDIEGNLSSWGNNPRRYEADYLLVKEGDAFTLGNEKSGGECMTFTILHTPGHTPGGICILFEKEKIMFTGDTIFLHSYGRTDFKYGSSHILFESLRRLLSLDPKIFFYPGHYQSSTIGVERNYYGMD